MQYLKPADIADRYDLLAFMAGQATLRETHPASSAMRRSSEPVSG
jgi:hypothetical protein